jgi:hypothetical protein
MRLQEIIEVLNLHRKGLAVNAISVSKAPQNYFSLTGVNKVRDAVTDLQRTGLFQNQLAPLLGMSCT